MTRADPPALAGHRRLLRWGLALLLLCVTLLVAAYIASPWLLQQAGARFAQRLGVSELNVEASRPTWRQLNISRLSARSDTARLHASNIQVRYRWRDLVRAQFERIDIGELDVALSSQAGDANAPSAAPQLPTLPVRELSVATLTVRFPDTGFVGTGHATLNDAGLAFSMHGEEPAAAARLRATATLTRAGVFRVRVGERAAQDDPFVTLDGTLVGDTMAVAGHAMLQGFPLALASEIVGAPSGSGRVTAQFDTQLPWPLPENIDWRDLHLNLSNLAMDWTSDDQTQRISALAGGAQLARGDIDARLHGELAYQSDALSVHARLPRDYALRLTQGTLSGGAGLELDAVAPDQQVQVAVEQFALRVEDNPRLDVIAQLRVAANQREAVARLSGYASVTDRASGERVFTAQAKIADDEHDFFTLNGSVSAEQMVVDADVHLADAALQWVQALVGAPTGTGRIRASVQTATVWPLPPEWAPEDLRVDVPKLSVDWRAADGALTIKQWQGRARLERGALESHIGGAAVYRLDDRRIDVLMPANYALRYAAGVLSGGPGLRLHSVQDGEDLRAVVSQFKLKSGDQPRLDIAADIDSEVSGTRANGRLTGQFTLQDAQRPAAQGQLKFDGQVNTQQMARSGVIDARVTLKGDALAAQGTLSADAITSVPFTVGYNLSSTAGTLTATKKFEFLAPAARLFLPDWNALYDLDRGTVDARFALRWDTPERIGAQLSLNLADAAAHFDTYRFGGINGALQLDTDNLLEPDGWRLHPAQLTIARVDAGVAIADVRLDLSWSANSVTVTQATGTLLGGQASTTPFVYDIARGAAAFSTTLENVDLAEVLALEGDDISGSGRLDGRLPVVITDNVPTVNAGVVWAQPPGGTIRLASGLVQTSGQAELSFALRALGDFSYSKLETAIDYAANGDLTLGVTLQGRNPAVEKNRPIHYNLNISENIPVLLKSLRLKDRLNEDIEQRFNK